jgi:ATP-dependent Clp protease ATP-binding subunit ClpB
VDDTVLFKPLSRDEIGKIVDLQAVDLRKRLEARGIKLEITDKARAFIAEAGYDPVYGARPLKRYIQQHVETPLAREIIGGKVCDGAQVKVDVKGGELVVG